MHRTNSTAYGLDSASEKLNWRLSAACRDVEPELLWPLPHDYPAIAAARRVCDRCPAKTRLECIADGIKTRDWHSVRGGFTGLERKVRHRDGYQPADYPPPVPHVVRWCSRCRGEFVFNPMHPYQRICDECDARRKAVDQ